MGWAFYYDAPADPKAECERLCTWESETGTRRVLKSAMVGSTFYAAVEHIKPDGERCVWAAVILTKRERSEWGYKDMDETMGPVESRCPVSILNLLTPTDSEYANAWRQRCRANASKPRVEHRAGQVVQLGSAVYRLERKADARKGWIVTRVPDGAVFRMPSAHLARASIHTEAGDAC